MMTYVYAFLFCGFVCMIAQLILDNTKLTPGHVTSIFVVVGALLDVAGIYDKIVLYAGAGALIPITSSWSYGNWYYFRTIRTCFWYI